MLGGLRFSFAPSCGHLQGELIKRLVDALNFSIVTTSANAFSICARRSSLALEGLKAFRNSPGTVIAGDDLGFQSGFCIHFFTPSVLGWR
jgi:hypothetical protein